MKKYHNEILVEPAKRLVSELVAGDTKSYNKIVRLFTKIQRKRKARKL